MDAIYETPIPALLVGLVVGSVLGVGYLNTRDRRFLIGVGVVVVLVVGAVALERSVKTDREQIAETLDELASALQADGLAENSADEVIAAVMRVITKDDAESAQRTRQVAETNLRLAKITRASYSNLQVEVNKLSLPPSAEVRFDALISGEGRPPLTEMVGYRTYPLQFVIKMVCETDDRYDEPRWLIGDRIGWQLKTLGQSDDPGRFGFDTGEMLRQ